MGGRPIVALAGAEPWVSPRGIFLEADRAVVTTAVRGSLQMEVRLLRGDEESARVVRKAWRVGIGRALVGGLFVATGIAGVASIVI